MSEFQAELAELRTRLEENLPPPFVKLLHRSVADLLRTRAHELIVHAGAQAPDFELQDQRDKTRRRADFLGKGPLVITFYRGFWCPYCNADLSNLQSFLPTLKELGAQVIAISPELPLYSKKIIRRRKLQFDILTDRHNDIADKFGLRWQVGPEEQDLFLTLNVNLPLYHGDSDWTLPMPGRFVIDTNGRVVYSEAHPDYTRRPDLNHALEAVQSLC